MSNALWDFDKRFIVSHSPPFPYSRVTRPQYGAAYKEFFMNSDYEVFRKLGELLLIGPGVRDGLKQALKYK